MEARIVVGVDGSDASIAALHWARDEAERRGAVLEAVRCCHPTHRPGRHIDSAERSLEEVVRHAGLHPTDETDLDLRITSAEGEPGPTLCTLARGAELLVVGSRGYGYVAGALLGSVSQHCASHAPCPVVIVRDDD